MRLANEVLVVLAALAALQAPCALAAADVRVEGDDLLAAQPRILLSLAAPAGAESLVVEGLQGTERISSLYAFELDLASAGGVPVAAEAVLGRELRVTIALPNGRTRHVHGLCSRFAQSGPGRYRAEVVPSLWLLTRNARSRIFQEATVPGILEAVLGQTPGGLAVESRLTGTFQPRDHVVQYRETDFQFASRLMEEEGIWYFFRHDENGHTMVLGNTPQGHPDLPGFFPYVPRQLFDPPGAIQSWNKVQEIRPGKVVLWDHTFELPGQNLEATAAIQPSVAAGQVIHDLTAGGAPNLEIYDYPGEYAQRFDGVDQGGAERPAELAKVFDDAQRTAEIRMQEQAARALVIQGASTSPAFVPGHRFQLTRHFDGNGPYVLTGVRHAARAAQGGTAGVYSNQFECIPAGLPYRPERVTRKPIVPGTQTAIVVGPPGQEIFTDKYGRVKVRFHWDREGRAGEETSCWVRIGALHAGQEAGLLIAPRIGTEVIVSFLEGDPDQPIVVGSVYNAQHLPPRAPAD
ncbi:MAG TPA: type VI secretion system tip protein TssI/VgrG [Candidatus Polarisedimenticolia bacterium]|nr:type VI secretion system tip protein TssI/VgrG [Candidatus Polarisedimenticolia bacterium]